MPRPTAAAALLSACAICVHADERVVKEQTITINSGGSHSWRLQPPTPQHTMLAFLSVSTTVRCGEGRQAAMAFGQSADGKLVWEKNVTLSQDTESKFFYGANVSDAAQFNVSVEHCNVTVAANASWFVIDMRRPAFAVNGTAFRGSQMSWSYTVDLPDDAVWVESMQLSVVTPCLDSNGFPQQQVLAWSLSDPPLYRAHRMQDVMTLLTDAGDTRSYTINALATAPQADWQHLLINLHVTTSLWQCHGPPTTFRLAATVRHVPGYTKPPITPAPTPAPPTEEPTPVPPTPPPTPSPTRPPTPPPASSGSGAAHRALAIGLGAAVAVAVALCVVWARWRRGSAAEKQLLNNADST